MEIQYESRKAPMRRHTIVGCQSPKNVKSEHSISSTRSDTEYLNIKKTSIVTMPPLNFTKEAVIELDCPKTDRKLDGNGELNCLASVESVTQESLNETQWNDTLNLANDRLSLTVEEVVHIRSVMTKAELESLPVEIKIKEDVEKRKLCFLCLRTRFTLFVRGVSCKLCKRSVCTKCYSKMRIPTEHFRNVPVILLSPSLMNSPITSNTPSPAHTGVHSGVPDEVFPRTLMERLLKPELERRVSYNCKTNIIYSFNYSSI